MFLNFEFLRYVFHQYLLLSPVYQSLLLFSFSLVMSYFPYFKYVTLRVNVTKNQRKLKECGHGQKIVHLSLPECSEA